MSKKRKTREEKIIAELRKQLDNSKNLSVPTEEKKVAQSPTPVQKPVFNLQKDYQIKTNQTLALDYSYVKKDLTKTIFLTIVAIFAFIVLYWWINLGGAKILIK